MKTPGEEAATEHWGIDGTVWGGELVGNRIFRFDPETERFKVHSMPTTHSGPRRFDIAPDGVLWIPEYGGNNLTKFDPGTETFKQYPYPTSSALLYVVRVNQQTGMVWLATAGSDEVARFDPGMLDNEFVLTSATSRRELISKRCSMDGGSTPVRVASFRVHDLNVRLLGEVALVNGRRNWNRTYQGKPWSADFLMADIRVKRKGAWQIVNTHSSYSAR